MKENYAKENHTIERGRAYLLWDGDCSFCRRCVEIAARLDKQKVFIIAPHQNFSEIELKTVGLNFHRCARELQVVSRSGRTFSGAFAINYFLWQLDQLRVLAVLALLFPILFLVEVLGYKLVASNRMLFSQFFFPKAEPNSFKKDEP